MAPNGETMRALKAQLTPKLNALAAAAKAAKAAEVEKAAPVAPIEAVVPSAPTKPDPIQLAQYIGDDANLNDGPPIGQFGGSDPDPDDRPPRNDERPDKQVAVLPALVAAAPIVARVALPWVIKGFKAVGQAVLGATAGAAIGSRLLDKPTEDGKSGKREMLPPGEMPPNHTGGDQVAPEDMKINTETFPALDPVDLKDLTHIPGFTPNDVENVIEIFPDMSEERRKLLPLIIERRGDETTQQLNTDVAADIMGVGHDMPMDHFGGAWTVLGKHRGEHYMENRDPKGRKGSSFLDVSIRNRKTDRVLHINTIDTRADGSTPSKREQDAAERILINKENGDILVLVPKPGKGETLDREAFREYIRPIVQELNNEIPDSATGDAARPENQIHNFGKRGD